jgi:hypothetical protein
MSEEVDGRGRGRGGGRERWEGDRALIAVTVLAIRISQVTATRKLIL